MSRDEGMHCLRFAFLQGVGVVWTETGIRGNGISHEPKLMSEYTLHAVCFGKC